MWGDPSPLHRDNAHVYMYIYRSVVISNIDGTTLYFTCWDYLPRPGVVYNTTVIPGPHEHIANAIWLPEQPQALLSRTSILIRANSRNLHWPEEERGNHPNRHIVHQCRLNSLYVQRFRWNEFMYITYCFSSLQSLNE